MRVCKVASLGVFLEMMVSDLCLSHHILVRLHVNSESLTDLSLSIIQNLDLHHMLCLTLLKFHICRDIQTKMYREELDNRSAYMLL